MEGSGEPVSPFDSYVDLNPQALMVEGPRAAAQSIPAAGGGGRRGGLGDVSASQNGLAGGHEPPCCLPLVHRCADCCADCITASHLACLKMLSAPFSMEEA